MRKKQPTVGGEWGKGKGSLCGLFMLLGIGIGILNVNFSPKAGCQVVFLIFNKMIEKVLILNAYLEKGYI